MIKSIAVLGLIGALLTLAGVFCPWVSLKNELAGGEIRSGGVSGWEMKNAEYVTFVNVAGDPYSHYIFRVDGLLTHFEYKNPSLSGANGVLFGSIFMLALGIPLAFAGRGRPKAAGVAAILLFIGAAISLLGGMGISEYKMGKLSGLSILGVTTIEQGYGYGLWMMVFGLTMVIICATFELVRWKRPERLHALGLKD